MSKKIKLFIMFSVTLNLLLAGIVLGWATHYGKMHQKYLPVTETTLPKAEQKDLQQKLRAVFYNKDSWKEMKGIRDELNNILTAENFDAEAYKAQMQKMAEFKQSQQERIITEMTNLASSLSWEERKALAEMFKKGKRRPPEKEE